MLAAAGQAFQELFTPPFRSVLWKCVGFTVGLLALFIIAIEWTFGHFVQLPGWIETTIEWLGGFALVVGSIFLIPPVTSLVAGLYLDDIAAEVERTDYPSDPPGRELPPLQAVGLAAKFFMPVFLLVGVNRVLFPSVTTAGADGDRAKRSRIAAGGLRVALMITVLAVAVIAATGRAALEFAYKAEYAGAYIPLVILMVASVGRAARAVAAEQIDDRRVE